MPPHRVPRRPALVIFFGGAGSSKTERLVDDARLLAALDVSETAIGSASFSEVILATSTDPGASTPEGLIVDRDTSPYAFGPRLVELLVRRDIQSVVYMGGGSLPCVTSDTLAMLGGHVLEGIGVTNNLFSSDLVAFPVNARTLAATERCGRDNRLARVLRDEAGLEVETLPRTLETQFDIDDPADICVLAVTGVGGPRLQDYLRGLKVDLSRYRAALPLFCDTERQIVIAGRVGSHTWAHLERETACRVRVFSEERGMEADGRVEAGMVRSLVGLYLDEVGPARFFESLAALSDAAFVDTRVLLAHRRVVASREDRFLSDLGSWDKIGEPWLRELTRAACQARIPVLLGGHSLMSGGIMALNQFAWDQRDAGVI